MNLPDEKREAVAEVLAARHGCDVEAEDTGRLLTCRECAHLADALAPLLAGWLAEARDQERAALTLLAVQGQESEALDRAYERGLAEGEARAEAWDEGYEAGSDDTFSTLNPYRADAAEREAR